jgi:hypothetical protein
VKRKFKQESKDEKKKKNAERIAANRAELQRIR